ncbi:Mannose-1-phosphate guanylyltransferase/mannose-6-phosphate isomerase [Lentisphaera araneosa HTCC2155]|uniref:mannose-1-phosphate guanylyltransferase n=1 Tax=Lentisphaera araneosa HTCC2155 TaxID=313628 RepID=A6DHE5_9BACT|nr:mannose-1-phosphate guanylyltransferase/mannose-6-phosphate isomerase [Lentisphaera araneosa]EDM29028.1 Mannose-1-phosphate guanylyltransferase/mannose-6-phosphate isomerase [Lentisphaera araneosa HTCC2155]
MHSINTVIMSGGSGSRLWPMSRSTHPKQFLPLCGEFTMLQQTALRLDGLEQEGRILVVANQNHRFLVAEQLREIGVKSPQIILEPCARNTAPAVALAALQVHKQEPEALMLVLAADHLIQDEEAFRQAVRDAAPCAAEGHILTFGIVPDHPATGYGYIQAGEQFVSSIRQVDNFVEKPNLEKAEAYLSEGNFLWNSGMFLIRADIYLSELKKYRPDILEACEKSFENTSDDMDFVRPGVEEFAACPKDSIDYAIMEKSQVVKVIPLDAGWSDVGSWTELANQHSEDTYENSCVGDTLTIDSERNFIRANKKLIATVGVSDLLIVDTDDALLVAHKSKAQDVKKIVEELKEQSRPEADINSKVYRPWGWYNTIDQGPQFKVKRISVNPGAKLSLQKHHHRAEHWVVVTGTAIVTNGDKEILLSENQSTYIPIGVQHRLENPGKIDLEIIEVQSGTYLEEDDIVRLDDNYGRA